MAFYFKCENPECDMSPCYLKCDSAFESGVFGEEINFYPKKCPKKKRPAMDRCPHITSHYPDWKISPMTRTDPEKIAETEKWFWSDGQDRIPENIRTIIEGIDPFERKTGIYWEKLEELIDLIKDSHKDGIVRDDIIEDITKRYNKREILVAALMYGFRGGMIYAEMLEHGECGEPLTARDEDGDPNHDGPYDDDDEDEDEE